MSRELKSLQILILLLLVLFFTLSSYSTGKLIPEGAATFESDGFTILTNTTKHSCGQVFNNETVELKNSDFNFFFIFGIVPEHKQQGSHGMAFVFSPTRGLPGASSNQYLGLFNEINDGKSSNHVIAIELDIHKDEEFKDINENHVAININSLRSVVSTPAGYYDDSDGSFRNLSLISGKVMRLSVAYSHIGKQLSVTLSPAEFPIPPQKPLLSLKQDLSPYFSKKVYWGFTAATGSIGALHYVLHSASNQFGITHPRFEYKVIPILPPYPKKKSSDKTKLVLAICLTLSLIGAFGASWAGYVFYMKHKKAKQIIEEWEIEYGPHRFSYKDRFKATKGFKAKRLLGRGGFGEVFRGVIPGCDSEVAVKRTCPDSKQGMTEFLAEISTIGRLRHPNLVRLIGYCKHKKDMYLVYDLMPNGSLEKYLHTNEAQQRLTWEQRFKIIKDIASALLHLHKEWVKVIIHRDIKPANILMDHEMKAVLGDFGLARLHDKGLDTHQASQVAGTMAYMAPEFQRTGRATTSTDVFAFGLVMLQVVCGRGLIERRETKKEEVLVDWIMELWENGKIFDAAEASIRQEENMGEAELVLRLGMLCSHQDESIRPDISAVMGILNGVLQLPDSLLDVVREERLRRWQEISVDTLRDMSPRATLTFTNSFTDQEEH